MQVKYFNKATKNYMQRKAFMRTVAKYAGYALLIVLAYLSLVVIAI